MSTIINLTATLETETCISCGILFAIPTDLRKRLIDTHRTFYCPNGHTQNYIGETEAEKLRKELKRKEQELANKSIEKVQLENQLNEAKRKLERVSKGTCPCCKRSFQNLKKHMATKHPNIHSK